MILSQSRCRIVSLSIIVFIIYGLRALRFTISTSSTLSTTFPQSTHIEVLLFPYIKFRHKHPYFSSLSKFIESKQKFINFRSFLLKVASDEKLWIILPLYFFKSIHFLFKLCKYVEEVEGQNYINTEL